VKKLIISDGKRERSVVLVDMLVVGRDPACDVCHEDNLLSRRHAAFVAARDSVTVRDLGSRNGIYVNGLRTAERPLFPGDVVQIGPLRILYAHDVGESGILPEYLVPDFTWSRDRPAVPPPPVPMQSSSPPTPVPPSLPPTPLPGPSPLSGGATSGTPDEDKTRVLAPDTPLPRPAAPESPPVPMSGSADPRFQDGPTQFVPPPPSPSATRITPAAAPGPGQVSGAAVSRPSQPPAGRAAPPTRSLEPPPVELTIDQTRVAPSRPSPRALDSDLKGYVIGQSAAIAVVALVSVVVPISIVRPDALGVWLAIPLALTIVTTYLVTRSINRRFARIVRALKPDGALGGDSFPVSRGSSSGPFRS
jgi:hypothetical protein